MKSLGYDKHTVSEEDVEIVEQLVSKHLMKHCFGDEYEIKPEGVICEDILNKLGENF